MEAPTSKHSQEDHKTGRIKERKDQNDIASPRQESSDVEWKDETTKSNTEGSKLKRAKKRTKDTLCF